MPGLVVSWCVALVMRRLAPRLGLVDQPGHRKVHARPMPYGGGMAIWAGVVVPLGRGPGRAGGLVASADAQGDGRLDLSWLGSWGERLAEFVEPHLGGLAQRAADLWFFLAAGTVLMLLGLADDARELDWRFRLAVETLVAAAVVSAAAGR